jgi:hypothetical protein
MSLESIRARNAVDKSRGVKRTYSHKDGAAGKAAPLAKQALPSLTPCVRLGARIPGEPCGSPLLRCNLHSDITTRFTTCSGAARCCKDCPDAIPATAHPNIIAADDFARTIPPYPEGRYSGRGVVICGGGSYWPSVYVTVRMLRHVGCTIPIQVWYLGEIERDQRYENLLYRLNAYPVDALAHPAAAATRGLTGFPDPTKRHGPTHPPFQLKSFAVLHSPFAEALSLDADNYPCADPTALFDDLRYRQTGAVFWPDLPHTEKWTRWADWGVAPWGQACGLEVGQYLLDKRLAWGPLNLARWYDDHGDWCYGWGERFDHGDKGPWRVAFAKLRHDYTMFSERAVWKDIGFLQPGPDGRTPYFVHRSLSKFVLDPTAFKSSPQKAPNQRAGLPLEDVAFGFLDELRKALA